MASLPNATRRVSLTAEQFHSEAVRAQLFQACCAYGPVESVQYSEDANYSNACVCFQFQRLSSADRLLSDVAQRGQPWSIECGTAVPSIGCDVLLSSSENITADRLSAALPQFIFYPSAPSSTGGAVAASGPTFEEKTYHLMGRGKSAGPDASSPAPVLSSSLSAEQEATIWAPLDAHAAVVQHSCLGSYCGALHFASPHEANEFLVSHQLSLAEQHHIYATHVGTEATSPLATALPKMLARRSFSSLQGDAVVLRGYVVGTSSGMYCTVDAGVYASAEQPSKALLFHVHTNFLSVSLGDEVLVQWNSNGGLSAAGDGQINGKLLQVLVASTMAARRPYARAHLPATAARTLRTTNLARGLVMASAASNRPRSTMAPGGQRSTPTAAPQLPGTQRLTAVPGADLSRRTPGGPAVGVASRTATRARGGGGPVATTATTSSAKALASRLFQSIQQKKASDTVDSAARSVECLCAFPAGLRLFSRLLVRVERIAEDGLHTCAMTEAGNGGFTGPVFVPSSLVPVEAKEASWKTFAVVGERMQVCLLYMVAVGGSTATMRAVASKKEADMRRSVVAASSTSSFTDVAGEAASLVLVPGTALSATSAFQLTTRDIGITASATSSFPAYMMRPAPHASLSLHQLPLLLPVSELGSVDALSLATTPTAVVVSAVVCDMARGHYAIVLPAAVYTRRQERLAMAQQQKREAEVNEVKQRLAAVMGADIMKVLNDETEEGDRADAKRQRTEE